MRRLLPLLVTLVALTAAAPAQADEPRSSSCSVRDWSGEMECAFTYQGTTLAAGFYGTGVLTVEKEGALGLRKIIFSCEAVGGGCVGGRQESRESLPIGTPLYCHIRGDRGSRFACLSRTPPEDGETIWV